MFTNPSFYDKIQIYSQRKPMMTMYKYETHLHTSPVSRCARVSVRENLEFYKQMGFDGVFITNHFIDGNINDCGESYEEKINYYCSDYEAGVQLAQEIGIKVFFGIETSYKGTDFLVYGLDKAWFLAHPEIMSMKKREQLQFFMDNGALVIQAHPYREANYIDHIRLFPRSVHGVEVYNACRTPFENKMAELYAENYELLKFAGSDNHVGATRKILAGMCSETPVENERDFVERVKNAQMQTFSEPNPLVVE